MASKRTDNLNLHAWERTDAFMMDEFNENFDAIDKAVAAKAEQTALEAETAAREALTGRVDNKAEQAALEAETAAREIADAALAALTGRVGSLEEGRLVFKFDTYIGSGTYTSKNPSRLEFDFKPLLLLIAPVASTSTGGFPWLRGQTSGKTLQNNSYQIIGSTLTWEDRAVSWYGGSSSVQMSEKDTVYYYFALGIRE